MAINIEAAQMLVGAAILDQRFCQQLLSDREQALETVNAQPGVPFGLRLSPSDRAAFGRIQASSLREFAVGIERLRRVVPARPVTRPQVSHRLATLAG